MGIVVRQVAPGADFDAIARLRYEVAVGEQQRRLRGTDDARREVRDELDEVAIVLGAYESDEPIATGRIVPLARLPADSPWRAFYETARFPVPDAQQVIYGRLLVRASHRASMAIPHLLFHGYERARADGVEIGFLHCAPSLVPLYEVLGCRRYRGGAIDPDTGFRLPMVQLLGDHEHFARVRAPILNLVRRFPPNAGLAQWFAQQFAAYSQPASVRMLGEDEFLTTLSRHVHHESTPLFENLSPEQVQQLIQSSSVFEIAPGTAILRRADAGAEMYLVLEGAVEISVAAAGGERRILGTLGQGQFFGEGGFLFGQPRSADVAAIAPTRLLALGAESFEKIIARKPELAARVLLNLSRVLCQRLYSGN